MKYLIFGGTGFLGKTIVEECVSQGNEVVSVGRKPQKNTTTDKVSPIQLDISKKEEFSKLENKPDVIINCASKIPEAGKTSKDPDFVEQVLQSNVLGALNIANWGAGQKVAKIFNCSTLATVHKPWPSPLTENTVNLPRGSHTAYGMSKLFQEQLMTEALIEGPSRILHLRLSAVYGANMVREGILFNFLKKLRNDEPIQVTDGYKTNLDFINARDVAKIILKLSQMEIQSGIVNLASGKPISIIGLIKILANIAKKEKPIIENVDTDREPYPSQINLDEIKTYLGKDFTDGLTPLETGIKEIET